MSNSMGTAQTSKDTGDTSLLGKNDPKLLKTREHYDTYPYEVDVQNNSAYSSTHSHVGRFILKIKGGSALDLGCGPGNVLPVLARRASYTVGLDLSQKSLDHAAGTVGDLPIALVRASALDLPFPNESFDFVVATGSLHHTPDAGAAFAELCRVLRSDGLAFIAVYHAASYYFVLYHTLGTLAQFCERFRLTSFLVNRCLILPIFTLYVIAGRLVVHRKLAIPSYTQLMNYFADQLLNPVVSFHRASEFAQWAGSTGVKIISVAHSHGGALINVEIHRTSAL